MVKIEVDTKSDSLEDLEEALHVIERAVARRGGKREPIASEPVEESAQALVEEASVDTPFFKISVSSDADEAPHEPTVNELLENESLTEDEMNDLLKQASTDDVVVPKKGSSDDDGYIEIVELEDDDIE